MAGLISSIRNVSEDVVSFFTGKRGANYAWQKHFSAYLQSREEVLSIQCNWVLNPGYAFVVVSENGDYVTPYRGGSNGNGSIGLSLIESSCSGLSDDTVTFSELKLNINPQNVIFKEPYSIEVTPTQSGVITQHSGSVIKDIIIAGTTGVHSKRGAGGVVRGTLSKYLASNGLEDGKIWNVNKEFQGQIDASKSPTDASQWPLSSPRPNMENVAPFIRGGVGILNGEPPGFYHFHILRNYIRSYVQLKTSPDHKAARLVFRNKKDGEDWIVEPVEFTMQRNSRSPMLYNYNIVLRALKKVTVVIRDDADLLGGFGTFLNTLQSVENIVNYATEMINLGAGIIAASFDYVSRIEQGFENTVLGPVMAVRSVVQAISNGVNTVSALPRKFYTDLQATIKGITNRINDMTNTGSPTYNDRYGRVDTAPEVAADRTITLEEINVLKGLSYWDRALTMILATDQIFGTETSNPSVTSLDAFSVANSIVISSNPKLSLNRTTLEGIEKMFGNNLILTIPASAITTTIRDDDTLEMISLRMLGDVSRWYEIALLNQLKSPYIESTGSKSRCTLGYGDSIYIPSSTPILNSGVIKGRTTYLTRNLSEIEKSLGVDLELTKDNDLQLDVRQDLSMLTGGLNAAQAIHICFALERGSLKYHPYKGVNLSPESRNASALDDTIDSLRNSVTSDIRFSRVSDLSLVRNGSMVYVCMRVWVSTIGKFVPLQVAV